MKKRTLGWILFGLVVMTIILLSIEETNAFISALVIRIFLFVKHNTLRVLATFFLVKGKFILTLFLKKLALLSVTGLGKRYVIEKVITRTFKIHFLDHLKEDMGHLFAYVKKNFRDFPVIKQILTVFAFLASLGVIGKFMGGMLAVKVFLAKFWSFLLALVLKFSTAVAYFFTDYLWGSWIAPIIEVVVFTWILGLLERVPFLKKYLVKIYEFFLALFELIEELMERFLHIPLKRLSHRLVQRIQKQIYRFIGYEKLSARSRLVQMRSLRPNRQRLLKQKRHERKQNRTKSSHSSRVVFLEKRALRKRKVR